MEKFKNILKPDWRAIVQNLYSQAIWITLGTVILGLWGLITSFDPLELKSKMDRIFAILLYLLMALGAGMVLYSSGRLLNKLKRRIHHLEVEENIIEYNALRLEADREGMYVYQHARVGASLSDEIRLWVIVTNGSKTVYECQVVLVDLEYHGNYPGGKWGSAPSGFDRKPMKWDVGYVPREGKIELENNAEKVLEIAKAIKKHPAVGMVISHLDGYSTKKHNLEGKYRATLRIDGKVLVNNVKKPIRSLSYAVTFEYQQMPLLKIVEIREKTSTKAEINQTK